jgi:hypothetical protein
MEDLVAVLRAVRARRPKDTTIHSDQGCRHRSDNWQRFFKNNRLQYHPDRKAKWIEPALTTQRLG